MTGKRSFSRPLSRQFLSRFFSFCTLQHYRFTFPSFGRRLKGSTSKYNTRRKRVSLYRSERTMLGSTETKRSTQWTGGLARGSTGISGRVRVLRGSIVDSIASRAAYASILCDTTIPIFNNENRDILLYKADELSRHSGLDLRQV